MGRRGGERGSVATARRRRNRTGNSIKSFSSIRAMMAWGSAFHPPEPDVDGNLPQRGRRDEDRFRCANDLYASGRQLIRLVEPPVKNLCIERNPASVTPLNAIRRRWVRRRIGWDSWVDCSQFLTATAQTEPEPPAAAARRSCPRSSPCPRALPIPSCGGLSSPEGSQARLGVPPACRRGRLLRLCRRRLRSTSLESWVLAS